MTLLVPLAKKIGSCVKFEFWFPATISAQIWMKVVLKPWPELKDSLDIFGIQIEQEIKK